MRIRTLAVLCLIALMISGVGTAADRPSYQKPPKVVSDILESPPTPAVSVAPSRDRLLEMQGVRHPSIADFREAMAEGTGQRALVEKVFAEQVYNVRKVDDRVTEFESEEILPEPGLVEVNGKVVERKPSEVDKSIEDARAAFKKAHPKAKDGEGPFEYATSIIVRRAGAVVPQTVLVRFEDGSSQTLRLPGTGDKRWARWRLVTKSQAKSVELDPERRVFLDKDKLDDSRTLEADGTASRRWSADIAAFFQSLLALLVTV